MPNITTCSVCEKAYEEASEEAAHHPYRTCQYCQSQSSQRLFPLCRLCGHEPHTVQGTSYLRCSNPRCRLSHIEMTHANWDKLHGR
jgi:DNA-directed RNA polymerase subunit RPC12/RpoP